MCDAVIKKWELAGPQPLNDEPGENKSGLWLFTDRTKPDHFFPPNFLPPYDDDEKRNIIMSFLEEEWDDETLSWKPATWGANKGFFDVVCGNPIDALLGKTGQLK